MGLGPRLNIRQSQSLVMTPQLQQAIKLLTLSNLDIENFIGDTLAANPLLEVGEGKSTDTIEILPHELPVDRRTSLEGSGADHLIAEGLGSEDRPLDIDTAALDRDCDTGDFRISNDAGWGAEIRLGSGEIGIGFDERAVHCRSLAEHLEVQVSLETSDSDLAEIAYYIIGQLDDAGYLTVPLQDLACDLDVSFTAAEAGLRLVQSLEPGGVGARSLSECIAIQAKDADRYDPWMALMIDNLDLLAKGDLPKLKRVCGVDDEDFVDMLAELRSYDPKPGLRFSREDNAIVTPDILMTLREDGGWDVAINQATLPRLIVNRNYYVELKGGCADKASKAWLSEKLADANWLLKALDQRQKTILKVAAEIVKQQDSFFRRGILYLRPLTLKAVAQAIGMHESTVSRVTSNKFLHCPRGTFELKYFFTSGVGTADGEGGASAEAVKAAIRQLIEAENPKAILSDDTLVELLKEKGFGLARRTVAKYREAIGLGSSVQRRRLKALAAVR